MKRWPYGRATWHSHSLAAVLLRAGSPPQPPAHRPPTSESPRIWSYFCNQETETFPASQSSPWPLFLKKKLVFPLLEEAGPLCLATNRLPTSRCAQSIHPHTPKGRAFGESRRLALHQLFSHRSVNSRWTEMSFHPQQWGPCSGPWPIPSIQDLTRIKGCFSLCASPVAPRRLSNVAVSNHSKAGPCFYFCSHVAALQSLVASACGMNRPAQAAWGVKETTPSSRRNAINNSIWFSVDKAALTLPPPQWWAHLARMVWWGSLCALCQGNNLLWSTLFPWADRVFNGLYYAHFIPDCTSR